MSDDRLVVDKDPNKEGMEVFPVDETPTPTRILKLANDLFPDFQDPKENPFDIHFRKAAEAVKSGTDGLARSLSTTEDDSLNTPSIFPISALNTPTILKSVRTPTIAPEKPPAVTKPHRPLKPLLPNPRNSNGLLNIANKTKEGEDAQLLLKTADGQTFKLFNVPVVNPLVASCSKAAETYGSSSSGGNNKRDALSLSIDQNNRFNQASTSSLAATRAPERKDEEDLEERRERNRCSARRSRIRKQKYFDELTKSQKALANENSLLRGEIARLKSILREHLHCNVTRINKSHELIKEMVAPQVFIQPTAALMAPAAKFTAIPAFTDDDDDEDGIDDVEPIESTENTVPTVLCKVSDGTLEIMTADMAAGMTESLTMVTEPEVPDQQPIGLVTGPEDSGLVQSDSLSKVISQFSLKELFPASLISPNKNILGDKIMLSTTTSSQPETRSLPASPSPKLFTLTGASSSSSPVPSPSSLPPPQPSAPSSVPASPCSLPGEQSFGSTVKLFPRILPRPPPQTVAEDLTTKKQAEKRPLVMTETREMCTIAKRQLPEPVPVAPPRAVKRPVSSTHKPGKRNGSLGQKLKDIKNKMCEDRHIDDFLVQIKTDKQL